MTKFEITQRKNGEFQFNLKAGNGEIILTSEGYKAKEGCKNGIESVKKNAPDPAMYQILTSKDGKYYFNLKSPNGQVIGTSEMYESIPNMNNGIASVTKNAPVAEVKDLTA